MIQVGSGIERARSCRGEARSVQAQTCLSTSTHDGLANSVSSTTSWPLMLITCASPCQGRE